MGGTSGTFLISSDNDVTTWHDKLVCVCVWKVIVPVFLPRHDALLASKVLLYRFRVSNLVLTWTPLITSSNPSGCSPHSPRYSSLRVLFSFNIIPV